MKGHHFQQHFLSIWQSFKGILNYLIVFASDCRSMWALVKTDIGEGWLHMEENVPGPVWQNKEDNQERHIWIFLNYLDPYTWKIIHKCWSWSQIMGGNGCNELWDWQCARQCNTAPNCFCEQSLLNAEQHCDNIEWEVPRILDGLERSHHYCFAKEACVITDQKPLVAIISRDMAILYQHIMQHIH